MARRARPAFERGIATCRGRFVVRALKTFLEGNVVQGTIKFFELDRGFGFVGNEGGEWFFHKSQVLGPIARGDAVEFWLDDSPTRAGVLVAVEVCRMGE